MREILFRGKRIDNGEWVVGGIVHQTDYYGSAVDRYFIIDGSSTQDYDIGFEYEVNPTTAGQYTGLTDKNGKKIFEGDIIEASDFSAEDGYGVIEWDDDIARFAIIGELLACDFDNYRVPSHWGRDVEVIGNIHDNPELIGGED